MANIPGISGFIQPGAFARDRVLSRGVSIPGGVRIVCILGEGLREETIVQAAAGSGQDGDADCSPTGSGDGRFFKIQNVPVVSGRTELRLNGTLLFGKEDEIDANGFDSAFDYRIDISTGCIELQGASIGDQDGKGYSAASMNVGTGTIVEDSSCDPFVTLDILDDSAPDERWTVRCVSVVRDSNGDPISGLATFSLTGSESGQIYDSSGSPISFHSSYYTSGSGAISGTSDECSDGFVVAYGDNTGTAFGQGSATLKSGDSTPTTTDTFVIPGGDLVTQGQAMAGDFLCIDGYAGYEIEEIEFDGTDTTITLATDSLGPADWDDIDWEIRATNLLIDDPSIDHNTTSGAPDSEGSFTSGDLGKTVVICAGTNSNGGRYTVSAVTSTRRIRVHALGDESAGLPDLEGTAGLSDTGLTFHMLENNGILLLGIEEGAVPFEVGDKFYIDVNSRALALGDNLEAKYIFEGDLNDPQFFTDANSLFTKHGNPSEDNTLSLGSQMAMENGAPAVLAVQCKPAVPRRTSLTLLEERDALGVGGFPDCGSGCEVDDLRFVLSRPITGLREGRPDSDSRVNIFVVRDGEETQVFPNKVDFYNSQLETETQQYNWIGSTDSAFSYTVVNVSEDIVGNGIEGEIGEDEDGFYFSTPEFDFDGEHVGMSIVITSMENAGEDWDSRDSIMSKEDISDALGLSDGGVDEVELTISAVTDDSKVYVVRGSDGDPITLAASGYEDVNFFIKDASATPDDACLLLHEDLVTSGVIQAGDGIRISYVDENDADYFDTNWFNALEALEAADAQIIVPLPTQAISSIFRATVNHCENMSSVANRKERVAFIGAQMGVTADALIGTEEVAVEDIGILEGIQGDDPEEVLDGNVEDLVNFKLSDNYTSNRCVYMFPDAIVRNVNGTNINLHGFYMAPAAAGWLSARQNVALPLTFKTLSGFSLTRDKVFRPIILNSLGNVGATVVEPVTGGGKVLAGRTTSQSGFVEDEEISIIFIRDTVKRTLRNSLKGFIGGVQSSDTNNLVGARVSSIMSALIAQGLVTQYKNVRVEQDKVDPRQINVFLQFTPAYPINYVFIDIEVGII
jgi:hypothetical protein